MDSRPWGAESSVLTTDSSTSICHENPSLLRVADFAEEGTASLSRLEYGGEGKFSNAIGRWAGLGPYYAMFPMNFAVTTVRRYCPPEGWVLDPFAGRGTAVFAAATAGRIGTGIEIHPAGWLYGQVKLSAAPKETVIARLVEIAKMASSVRQKEVDSLSEFFHHCFSPQVLRFLIAVRKHMVWSSKPADMTLMAFMLTHLHGPRHRSLSNQMRQAKAMSPEYSVRWWKSRRMSPPDRDPVEFLRQRIEWRYRYGRPSFPQSQVYMGDSTLLLDELRTEPIRYDLLLTSPPYFAVCNYHADQWLRLWLLGGEARPVKKADRSRGGFQNVSEYRELLQGVFASASLVMKPGAAIYVRTDARPFTLDTTHDALKAAFPGRRIRKRWQPFMGKTQTHLYGDSEKKPGEVDLIISAKRR